jgi:hypothetical protein
MVGLNFSSAIQCNQTGISRIKSVINFSRPHEKRDRSSISTHQWTVLNPLILEAYLAQASAFSAEPAKERRTPFVALQLAKGL